MLLRMRCVCRVQQIFEQFCTQHTLLPTYHVKIRAKYRETLCTTKGSLLISSGPRKQ